MPFKVRLAALVPNLTAASIAGQVGTNVEYVWCARAHLMANIKHRTAEGWLLGISLVLDRLC
jgi:hypothetical protein